MGCTIIGCGKQLPALDVPNEELTKLVDTSDEWISTRTGILSRRVCVSEGNVDLAEGAARQALGWADGGYSERKIAPEDIDLIIYSTITPDEVVPTCAAMLRRRLGLVNAAAFDMNAACSGFIYGLTIAETMIAASAPGAVGAAGRNPCVLFGDGAGAAVVEWDERKPGILAWYIKNDDDDSNALTCPSAYDAPQPFTPEGIDANALQQADPGTAPIDAELDATERVAAGAPRQALYMNGQKVFKFATSVMPAAIEEVLRRANLTIDDVQFIVPHQANLRIIKYAAKRMGLPLERFQVSIAHRGNSSSACIPMTLCDAYESGNIHPGDKVVLVGFGGGFTSGAVLYEA